MSIVVFGSINFDLTTYVPHLPAPGETLHGRAFITVPGGKGANQAVATTRLGAPTRFFARLGNDAFGREVRPVVAGYGLDMSDIVMDDKNSTGLAVIAVDEHAENSIVLVAGANMAMDESDVQRCLPALEQAKALLLQLEVPLQASLDVAQVARQRGVKVIWDPAPAQPLPTDAYALIDYLTPNEMETSMLVGFQPTNPQEAARAAALLCERGVQTTIIKMGAQGAYFQSHAESGFVPAFVVNAIDSVAAGDAFNGGLAVAVAEGKPLAEAVRWGAAAGALATTKAGAMPSMPNRAELEQLLR